MDFRVQRYVAVRMRDGINLVGDLYFPNTDPPFASIIFRTPYGRDDEGYARYARLFASNGFVFLNTDVRGRGDSEGRFRPYLNEGKDGYDLIEWTTKQPWSNGRVGTFGASYSARIQWLTAIEKPRNLKAMISVVSPSDPFVESPTGVNDPMHISWRYTVSGRTLKNTNNIDWERIYEILPLKDMPEGLGMEIPDWTEDMDHQTLDEYWERIRYQNKFSELEVPTMHVSGWYDDEQIGTFINYVGMRNHSASDISKENQAMIIGPWGHQVNASSKLGNIDFSPSSMIDLDGIYINWFKRWLRNEKVSAEPRVRVFIMGTDKWANLDDWPPSKSKEYKLFLSSKGKANSRFGDGILVDKREGVTDGQDTYIYNPVYPVPFVTEITSKQIGGPDDYSSVERRDDVLVYTAPALDQDITVLGQVEAHLFVSTDVTDTDFMAMLLDVWPTGFSQRLCDGMVRERYRNGMEKVELLEPGKVYEIKINMWNIGHTFKKGHKIGLQISSSAFPKYSRNLNTGLDLATDFSPKVATNRILHSQSYASHLSLRLYD